MATIFNSFMFNSAILDSAILHKTLTQTSSIWLKLIHSDSTWWWQPSWFLQCWIQTLLSWIEIPFYLLSDSLKKHSHSILTLTQYNSIWLTLIHSHLTWWWQSYWMLPSCIQPSYFFLSNSLTLAKISSQHLHKKTSLIHSDSTWWWQPSWILASWIQPFCTKRTLLIHSDSTWWWQPSWIVPRWIQTLPSWIQTPCYLLSDSLKNTLPPFWLCPKLIPSD